VRRGLLLFALGLLLAGCASAPVTRIVLPQPEMSARDVDPPAGFVLRLRDVTLPGYLETYPVVVGRSGNVLTVSRDTEWAERLPEGVPRVLRDALSQRFGASGVLFAGDHRAADADLRIEFLALDPVDRMLELDARWFYTCTATRSGRGARTRLQEPIAGIAPADVAKATTGALMQLADVLAREVRCAPSQASQR
jgi:uncharacterized lipoprotein YmbA